jgi:hypothetical protein
MVTMLLATPLVDFAGAGAGRKVLDVLERARYNSQIAHLCVQAYTGTVGDAARLEVRRDDSVLHVAARPLGSNAVPENNPIVLSAIQRIGTCPAL